MAVNKTSRRVWKYETTPRTSALQNAADVPYFFGEYGDEVQKWNMGAMENKREKQEQRREKEKIAIL